MPRCPTRVGDRSQAIGEVERAISEGKRVLWVTQTVRRCHEITADFVLGYDRLQTKDGKPVYCYHSRFKLVDRVARHNDIVDALKVGRPAALGVTTQVCEMSLDLDVGLLVTEECSVTSLIHARGRVQSRAECSTTQTIWAGACVQAGLARPV